MSDDRWEPINDITTVLLPQREEDAARTLSFRDNVTGEMRYLFLPEHIALCRRVRVKDKAQT